MRIRAETVIRRLDWVGVRLFRDEAVYCFEFVASRVENTSTAVRN